MSTLALATIINETCYHRVMIPEPSRLMWRTPELGGSVVSSLGG